MSLLNRSRPQSIGSQEVFGAFSGRDFTIQDVQGCCVMGRQKGRENGANQQYGEDDNRHPGQPILP